MKLKAFKILTIAAFATSGTLVSCVADDNSPGLEYMPDMYRSPAVEAYVDYGEVRGMYDEEAQAMVEKKFSYKPPMGTVAYTGSTGENYLAPYNHAAPNGADRTHGLYGVAQDTAGRNAAINDINPVAYTKENASEGQVLYERFCMVCHGAEGDGQGPVVTNSNGKYPTPGPYKKELTAGEIFYTITYGKNAMGSYASQVNPMERWKIVNHVRALAGNDMEIVEELLFDPMKDTDGDGVMDNKDECPAVKGSINNNGCPDMPIEIKQVVDVAVQGLTFELGSAKIAASSYNGLNNLAGLLATNPDYSLLVNGHTDNTGNAFINRSLSLKRSMAVRSYLIEKGVDKSRVVPVGYGSNKPVATNETADGRQMNRRVEFRLF